MVLSSDKGVRTETKGKSSRTPVWRTGVENHVQAVHPVSDKDDPQAFDLNTPLLSSLALDVLCILGSSASVLRVFTTA